METEKAKQHFETLSDEQLIGLKKQYLFDLMTDDDERHKRRAVRMLKLLQDEINARIMR